MYAAAGPVTLRTNLADYAITKPLKEGRVPSTLVQFDFCGPTPANKGFKPLVRKGEYDASELAIVTYLQAKDQGKRLTLLPAVIMSRGQLGHIMYNPDKGELQFDDISRGLRIGVRSHTQTTVAWVRGMLESQYGITFKNVEWVYQDEPHLEPHRNPERLRKFQGENKPLDQMLIDGDVDIAIGIDRSNDARLRTLLRNPQEAEQLWRKANGYHPINHLFVVDSVLARERPDAVRETYRMLMQSRNAAQLPQDVLAYHPFGMRAVRPALEAIAKFSHEQGIISRRLSAAELFDDVTGKL